ncbi:cobalamin B12-binding domain-containing protein [Lichenicoccus sp.]|uniref:cobalamin B12-binding domain-containing protein n=1 Tax=Lichenicoccus sp. TaxID=2781899 RepID=UPI003D115FA4
MSAIANVVESEIVPRLLAAHEARQREANAPPPLLEAPLAPRSAVPADTGVLGEDFVAAFADELIGAARGAIEARIDRLASGGMSAEDICLHALAPTARHLGDLWERDLCSFIDVTAGTATLHGIMNALRPAFANRPSAMSRTRTAMLVTAPGEQHRFGLSMLAEFFRKEGWQVALPLATTIAQITAQVAARPVDVLGFSAGSERVLGALAACIAAVRASAYNPDVVVMVGGPIFLARPEFVAAVGADGTAGDAPEAVRRAFALLKARRAALTRRLARPTARSTSSPAKAAACDRGPSHAP